MKLSSRRKFFKQGLGAVAAAVAGAKVAEAAVCQLTARQTSGPFIPNDFPFRDANEGTPYLVTSDSNADLTVVDGQSIRAQGQVLYLNGQVVDQNCNPVAGASVYLWQADIHGHYNHSEDPNVHSLNDLDPGFQYRGAISTDAQGRFAFKTIKPKYYPLDESGALMRTAHLHIAVLHPNCRQLITQTYFEGDILEDIARIRELNAKDIVLAPRGEILPQFRSLIIEYKMNPSIALDAPVGEVRLSVQRLS